jgi:Fe-S-cluster-containing dehydrogenase component
MKRLFIDLERCRACGDCRVPCSNREHPANDGVMRLRETAEFAVMCKRCADAPCVNVCPAEALEKTADGAPFRHGALCVSCASCCFACPFGVILQEYVHHPASRCDFCEGRLVGDEPPVCTCGCPKGAIRYGEFREDPAGLRIAVGNRLVVVLRPWNPGEAP